MSNVTENKTCLACGSTNLTSSLNLGNQPLANNLKYAPETQDTYPLAVNLCEDCCHLQLSHTVDPKVIYSNYLYVAGTSQTLKDYSDWFAGYVLETMTNTTNNVLDIGCNDGTQLNSFRNLGINTFGIDPAENIYPTSSKNHNVICDYFGPNIVDKVHSSFDAITAQNVFAHNPNPLEFLETCKQLMDDHTLLFIQTSQADMVLNNEFDTIYHEHINFFNSNSMNELAKRANLNLIDVIKTPIHGNSYVFVLSKTKQRFFHMTNVLKNESKLLDTTTYKVWEKVVYQNTWQLRSVLNAYSEQGYKIIGYGAAAKGNTLLNYIKTPLDLIIDDSPLKQDMYCPGHNTPIKSIEALMNFSPNDKILFMPLAWNFFDEISQRIKKVRDQPHDLFLKYFPEVDVK
jgi:2-polyprenyl-3-methyl-5-hydroxy-6-metoxy-1,4-benzoquinol methylase